MAPPNAKFLKFSAVREESDVQRRFHRQSFFSKGKKRRKISLARGETIYRHSKTLNGRGEKKGRSAAGAEGKGGLHTIAGVKKEGAVFSNGGGRIGSPAATCLRRIQRECRKLRRGGVKITVSDKKEGRAFRGCGNGFPAGH